MHPFGKDSTRSSRTKSISTPLNPGGGDTSGATATKPGKFNQFLGSIGINPAESLHLPSRKGPVIADLVQWGLTQGQAERIASQPGYLAAHSPALADESCCIDMAKTPWTPTTRTLLRADEKNLLTVCLAWAAVAPGKACQLINAALPLLKDPALARSLLVERADQLAEGIDPRNAEQIGEAIVKLAEGGWATPNSRGFVPEDVRVTLAALANHIHPLVGLRVKLQDARLRVESASLDQLPDLMDELLEHSAQAMRKSHKDVPGLLIDIRNLADRVAQRADTPTLRDKARQLNADAQRWRVRRAEKHMKDWLSIEAGHDLQTGAPTVKVTVNAHSPLLKDNKSRDGAQKWFREWLRAQLEMPEDIGLSWTALMHDVIHPVAGDPPGDAWLSAEHWVEFKLRQAQRGGDWARVSDHLGSARAGAIGTKPLQQVLKKLPECVDPAPRSAMLKAMLPHLPPQKSDPALHAQFLGELWHLASAQAPAGGELWQSYLGRYPLQAVDTAGPFAEYVIGLLEDAQTGTAEQRQVAVMKCLLREFPKPRAGTQWLTWEPACRALLDAAIAQVHDANVIADLLLRWLPLMAQVPTETRLADTERQFTLLRHALQRVPINARTALLTRMDATLTEQWKLWRENRSARKEKELPPFELMALHGAVRAQLQRPDSGEPSREERECPVNRLVAFFVRWSKGLELRANGQKEEATAVMADANTMFRVDSLQEYGDIPVAAREKYQQLSDELKAARKRHEY